MSKNQIKDSKKQRTLIESVIENSKQILLIKYTLHQLNTTIGLAARLKYKPISFDDLIRSRREYDCKIQEHKLAISILLRKKYTEDNIIIPDDFFISYLEMKAGFCMWERILEKDKYGKVLKTEKIVLFLSSQDLNSINPIEEGVIEPYELVKDRLKHASSVLDNNIQDILLGNYNSKFPLASEATIKKYKELDD